MKDLLGALAVALIGALICASGYLNFRDVKKRARGSRRWSRASAHVTKAWKQDVSGAAGDTTYHGTLTIFGAALTLVGLVGAAVISAALIR